MKLNGNLARLAGAGAAIAFGSALMIGAATPAQAAPALYEVINGNSSNSCLQVQNAQTGEGNVVLGSCDRSAKQVWTIAGGVFRNPASGHCLDGNGADVYTMPCNGGAFQRWTTSSGSPKYIRHTQSGKYLNANGNLGAEVNFQPTIATTSRWVIHQVG